MFRLPEVLTEAEVIEAEAELRALRRHALEVVDPEVEQPSLTRNRTMLNAVMTPSQRYDHKGCASF